MEKFQGEATREVVVSKIIDEAADTKSFVLKSVGGDIPCKSGQFLTFLFKSHRGKELRRSYSLSSSPELGEDLTVTVKRIINGEVSRYMLERLEVGNRLTTIGASGFFVLPDQIEGSSYYVFIAAGSGITPVYPLIKLLLNRHLGVKALLVYSNKSLGDVIFREALDDMRIKFGDRFHIEYLYSLSGDLLRSRLTPDTLQHLLAIHNVSPGAKTLFYTCGPADFMRMVSISLISAGTPVTNIRKEIFHVQQPLVLPEPPDKDPHVVELQLGDKKFVFDVRFPMTILQEAKMRSIPIPYSCENGQCGSCVAKCLQGKIWMTRNEVLLNEEIAQGKVLTCTGFPIGGDVILKI